MSAPSLRVDLRGLLTAVLVFGVAGACSSIGPDGVPRDRSDYAAAVGDSWKNLRAAQYRSSACRRPAIDARSSYFFLSERFGSFTLVRSTFS